MPPTIGFTKNMPPTLPTSTGFFLSESCLIPWKCLKETNTSRENLRGSPGNHRVGFRLKTLMKVVNHGGESFQAVEYEVWRAGMVSMSIDYTKLFPSILVKKKDDLQ